MTAPNSPETTTEAIVKSLAKTLGGEVIAFGIRLLAGTHSTSGNELEEDAQTEDSEAPDA